MKSRAADSTVTFREIGDDRLQEFLAKGYQPRHFFTHRFYFLPKGGPDGLKMAQRMCGVSDPGALWEVVLYAFGPAVDSFPDDLFFDPDLIWHQQHGGKRGQVATANLVAKGRNLYGMNYLSDLVQRISRRREFKTRIENRFKGWHRMLLNGILNFAIEKGFKRFYSPTADWTIHQIPPSRRVQRELFERVYDRALNQHFQATRRGPWWLIDVAANRDRVILPEKRTEPMPREKIICLCHDIERGLGHLGSDPLLASRADRAAPGQLEEMLAIEKGMKVKATYNVVGCFFDEVREKIEKDGHSLGFHSYDHRISGLWRLTRIGDKIRNALPRKTSERARRSSDQLARVREVDYRIKGFRPAQSKLTAEVSDRRLCFHNFEWLASSAYSLGFRSPRMKNGIVKIPILFDDFDMYKHGLPYQDWERTALEAIRRNPFVAFSLHDCYAQYWLPYYGEFLEKISEAGQLKTLDALANEVIFANAG
jgi:peptidoglycan/xylan/chitin deacetylase (PgdA/CDA1 family)